MSGLMSKRQQARNEKVLQELVHSVPGNNFCADCQARNPAWASWNLGIFLCMRCAAIHRKLGTHISKVKSLSMDSWSNEQVESMKRVGNVASNKIYNAQNKKPPMPIDADEADSAMERFIRAKYVQTPAANGAKKHNTGSSDEGTPPPLPPKTGSRFFSFRSKKDTHTHKTAFGSHDTQRNQQANKASKVFGASVHQDSPEATAQKLTQLRDMGFMDDKRNAMILKGVNGNLEKTVEALVRLGEGGGPSLPLPSRDGSLPGSSRSLTPQPTPTSPRPPIGLSKSSPPAAPSPASTTSNNPWDIQPAPPQSSQSTGTLQNRNPFYASNSNPFGMPNQQAEFNLNQSLQNLSLAPTTQQPLFPHHTGGVPTPQPISQSFFQQSMTPPIPQAQSFTSLSFNNNQTYPQPTAPAQVPQGYNPFLQAPRTPDPSLSLNTSPFQNQGSFASNPFTRSPTRIASPTLNQIPEQSQQNFYNSPHSPYASNPFFATNQQAQSPIPAAQPQPQPQFQQTQQQWYDPQPLVQVASQPQPVYQQQQPQRADTASIMALYNYPQLAPTTLHTQDQSVPNAEITPFPTSAQSQATPQQTVPSPMSGTKNPFMNHTAAPAAHTPVPTAPSPFASHNNLNSASSGARSRESMTLGMEMAWNNGRHSPDAFASLSARSM
ncbi:ArfGap-domain-containing protein [Annulohypoxylon stygium]|nr:ArfGap-domain-containing protein [Annulohypoxylon stygium]